MGCLDRAIRNIKSWYWHARLLTLPNIRKRLQLYMGDKDQRDIHEARCMFLVCPGREPCCPINLHLQIFQIANQERRKGWTTNVTSGGRKASRGSHFTSPASLEGDLSPSPSQVCHFTCGEWRARWIPIGTIAWDRIAFWAQFNLNWPSQLCDSAPKDSKQKGWWIITGMEKRDVGVAWLPVPLPQLVSLLIPTVSGKCLRPIPPFFGGF